MVIWCVFWLPVRSIFVGWPTGDCHSNVAACHDKVDMHGAKSV